MLRHQMSLRIYYKDTDAEGVVYYGRYADFFEIGRTELLRYHGLAYADLKKQHHMVSPVISMTVHYKKPIFYDTIVTLITSIAERHRTRLRFHYQIIDTNNVLHCEGHTINVCVDATTLKPKRFPAFFYEGIK